MKIVYIAHPVDVEGNLKKIAEIGRQINLTEPGVIPFAPYFFDCHCLDDNEPKERERGLKNGEHFFLRRVIDEVRLYGDRISLGMGAEIQLALGLGIPIRPMNEQVALMYRKMWNLAPMLPILEPPKPESDEA